MFTIVSGLPGASKTLQTIHRLKNSGTHVFYYNVPLTDKGKSELQWIELDLEQVRQWPDEIPPGATLLVDEAQILWPVRPSTKAVPPELQALETHRHKGVDIIFITQDPTLLDSHARKLANEHYHYIRPYGAKYAQQHHNGSGIVDVKSRTELANTIKKRVTFPKEIYPLYESAEAHTHKFTVPPKLLLLPLLIAIVGFLAWRFYSGMSDEPETQQPQNTPTPRQQSTPDSDDTDITQKDWAHLLTPEIQGLPYTAPLYKSKATQVTEVPRVAGCAQLNSNCQCYTQAGSIISGISEDHCKKYLHNLPFDHLRYNQQREQQERRQNDTASTQTDDQDYYASASSRPRVHFIPNSANR